MKTKKNEPEKTKKVKVKETATKSSKGAVKKVVEKELMKNEMAKVMDESYVKPKNVEHEIKVEKKDKVKVNFWAVSTLVLILLFGGFLAYEYNFNVKKSVNELLGIKKIEEKNEIQTITEKKEIVFSIVYNSETSGQKEIIEQMLSNAESKLLDIKIVQNYIDKNSDEGKKLLEKVGAKYLPVIVADKKLGESAEFAKFRDAAIKLDNGYFLRNEALEYVEVPRVGKGVVEGVKDVSKAKVVMIQYQSMTCGYCNLLHKVMKNLIAKYGDKMSLVHKFYDRGGPDVILAQMALCANDQNKFGKMMDLIYEKQSQLASAYVSEDNVFSTIEADALKAGIKFDQIKSCINDKKYLGQVMEDNEEAQSFGVLGTPSYFINGKFYGGYLEEDKLEEVIVGEIK